MIESPVCYEPGIYRYLVEIDSVNRKNSIERSKSVKIRLTYAIKSSHRIMRNLGISQAIIPGLDPNKPDE